MKNNLKTNLKDIRKLLVDKNAEGVKEILDLLHLPAILDIFNHVSHAERATLLRYLQKGNLPRVFSRLDASHKQALLKELSEDETKDLLRSLKPDERVDLLVEVPRRTSKHLLKLLEPEDLAEAKKLLSYPKNSVGRLMTPHFVAVKKDWDVTQVLVHMKERAKESETINVVYVVDGSWKLLGQIELNKIILADPEEKVARIIDNRVAPLDANSDQEQAVRYMNDHRSPVLPVVESDDKLVGIVTFDDIVDVALSETTEDIHKGSAIVPLNVSYRHSNIIQLFDKRIGWLMALVVVSLASSGVIAAFENTLASVIALAFFIPLLIGSGGNAGAQAATLMIRAISVGEIRARDWFKITGKEMLVGVSLATALGLFSSLMGLFRGGYQVGLIVGLSMATIIIVTNLLGTLLPFVLNKFRIDPAVASGPLVTSVADVIGLTIYFSIATVIIRSLG